MRRATGADLGEIADKLGEPVSVVAEVLLAVDDPAYRYYFYELRREARLQSHDARSRW